MKLTGRLAMCLVWAGAACAETRNFDVVVYGGTAGGVIAAVSAARAIPCARVIYRPGLSRLCPDRAARRR